MRIEIRLLNGMPAAVLRVGGARPPFAPVIVLQLDVDGEGRIAEIRSVMASRKLTALGAQTQSAGPRPMSRVWG
jgi:RNA polymerase sigma-70 factor (ECF subfamily)